LTVESVIKPKERKEQSSGTVTTWPEKAGDTAGEGRWSWFIQIQEDCPIIMLNQQQPCMLKA